MKTKLKITVLTWMGIYPLITGLLWFFGEYLSHFWLPFRTFVLTAILVPIMTLLMMPMLKRIFGSWIKGNPTPNPASTQWVTSKNHNDHQES